MKVNRELDELMVEVMGWHIEGWSHSGMGGYDLRDSSGNIVGTWDAPPGFSLELDPWHRWSPSTKIANAWQIVEKLYSDNYWLKLSNQVPIELGKAWRVEYTADNGHNGYKWADTAPLAICLAALETVRERKT